MSGLLKKRVQVDRNLSVIIGVPEGATVSYAEIQKGLHKYIRENNLRTDVGKVPAAAVVETPEPTEPKSQTGGCYCISCGEAIPSDAVFCDLCGTPQ